MRSAIVAIAFAAVAYASPESDPIVCKTCELVFNQVYTKVTSNSTEKDIENALDQACTIVPKGFLRTICDGWINEHVNELIDEIKADDTPAEICDHLGACGSNETLALPLEPQGGIFCPLCESAISHLYARWDNSSSTIEKEIDQLCDIVPKDIRFLCDLEVNKEYEKIKNGIENHDSPQVLCTDIGICTSAEHEAAERLTPTIRGAMRQFVRNQVQKFLAGRH